MRKNFTLSLLASLALLPALAQDIRMLPGSGIGVQNTAATFVSHTKDLNGTKYEDFSGSAKVLTMEKGSPALPVHTASVIVPDTGGLVLNVSYDSFAEYDNIEVLPSKGSLKRNINPALVAFEFGDAYQKDEFYPGTLAKASDPYILRDTRGVTVSFFPYQYNPVTKKLRVYHNITANVSADAQLPGINENSGVKSPPSNAFNSIYQNFYLNSAMYVPVPESGEMLIIAPDEYVETIAPLVHWKIKRGINTSVVTLAETGNTSESIKEYISEFYNDNPGLIYVLLVGDHEDLPSHTYGISWGSEELWSDSYYGQLEGDDYFPEALVGRFSGSVDDVEVMVARTLEYEISPLAGDWVTTAMGIGSNEGYGYGDDGEADWQHLRGIGESLLDHGYTHIYEFYESSQGMNDANGNPDPFMIVDAVNSGAGLLNYSGHGATDLFVTGNFTNYHVSELRNNGKYPFIVSVACNNGTFVSGTSLCEAWLNVTFDNSPAGAIAAAGSSILMAWAEPMQTQDGMTELITGTNPDNKKVTTGGLFYNGQLSMLEAYGLSDTAIEVMQTWVLFGDPSVTFRSAQATQIAAQHVPVIDYMADVVYVICSEEGALVAITQNGVVLGTGIVSGGVAQVNLSNFDNSDDALSVTVTQQNFIPYQGTIAVEMLGRDSFKNDKVFVYPNPAHNHITIRTEGADSLNVEVRDITGKLVYVSGDIPAASHTIDLSGYASGVYMLSVSEGNAKIVRKFVVQ